MTPILVAAPSAKPVDLPGLKLHCRVDSGDEDTLLMALQDAALGWLDGWSGVLGRAIMPQTWSVEASSAGALVLPMPDVTSANANYGAGLVPLGVSARPCGPSVVVDGPCVVSFECSLPDAKRPTVDLIIKLLVHHWFTNRGVVNANGNVAEVPMTADALIETLRWRRV